MGVLERLGETFRYLKANQVAAAGGYGEALSMLEDLHARRGLPMPSARTLIQTNIVLCLVAINLDRPALARRAADMAIRQLDRGQEYYRRADRTYLRRYCEHLRTYALAMELGAPVRVVGDLQGLDLSRVSSTLKKSYPLPTADSGPA